MKLVTCVHEGRTLTGLWESSRVLDLAVAGRRANEAADFSSMLAIVRGGSGALEAVRRLQERGADFPEAWLDAGQVEWLAPIPNPVRNVFCLGRDYLGPGAEGFAQVGQETRFPTGPQFFTQATPP